MLQSLNEIIDDISNLFYHNKNIYRQIKPNILLTIHYTSNSNSFSTPNTNSRPGNQSFIFKGYEVVHQLHTNLNPFMNDENLPLT